MKTAELSLIRFNVTNFFAIIINSKPFQPTTTILLKLTYALLNSETEKDKVKLDRLKWLEENTHEKIKKRLSIIELAVYKNLDKGLNRELEIDHLTLSLITFYSYIDEVTKELVSMVIDIAKKYSIDMPIIGTSGKTNIEI